MALINQSSYLRLDGHRQRVQVFRRGGGRCERPTHCRQPRFVQQQHERARAPVERRSTRTRTRRYHHAAGDYYLAGETFFYCKSSKLLVLFLTSTSVYKTAHGNSRPMKRKHKFLVESYRYFCTCIPTVANCLTDESIQNCISSG